jgi:hypothetical protein
VTVITLQAPVAPMPARSEPATPSAFALPPVQTVPSVPDTGVQLQMADQRNQAKTPAPAPERLPPRAIDPFPNMRFADPLPDLPELEITPPANPYQAALSVVRGEGSNR